MNSFLSTQKRYIDSVNNYLEDFFDNFGYEDGTILKAMKYSVFSGGKRTRPVLALGFCEMLNGDYESTLCAAASIEMVHTYSLIHDDLPCMDDDALRRGKPSCHIKYGEETAILAGDALLNAAFENIIFSNMDDKVKVEILKALSKSSGYKGMILGQELDLNYQNKIIDNDILDKIHRKKTGEMFSASCIIGTLISNTNNKNIEMASKFGFYLGLNFQIIDDILDVIGDESVLGKPIKSDFKNNKSTYVSILGIEKSRQVCEYLSNECKKILVNNFNNKSVFLIQMLDSLLLRKF